MPAAISGSKIDKELRCNARAVPITSMIVIVEASEVDLSRMIRSLVRTGIQ
ncbi:hypothetical protein D3C87_2131490 [compost metagenome]